jgi:hypothetical protein
MDTVSSDGRVTIKRQHAVKFRVLALLSLLSAVCLLPPGARARETPIDLRLVSAAAARQHLHELAADLEQYYPYLKTHQERARFDARVKRLDSSVHGLIPTWREWLLQDELIRSLNDPHAELFVSWLEDRALPVKLHWVSNGLLISPEPWLHSPPFPKNSEVLRIGNEKPGRLLTRLEKLYSGTPGWVAYGAGSMLRYAFELRWLGLMHGMQPVVLTLRTPRGQVDHIRMVAAALPNSKSLVKRQHGKPWFSWSLDERHDVGWFSLDSMRLTRPYERAVAAFFAAVENAGINRVVVDLRNNGGGNSLAEAPFMQYIGIERIQDYSTKQYFDAAHLRQEVQQSNREMRKLARPGSVIQPLPPPPQPPAGRIFHGHFFVVTGPGTFSSAMEFAADVKFNHIGTIVGLPPGEVVTGPGNVTGFLHPPSGVPFQVPTTVFTWPGLHAGALVEPDVTIPLTVTDVQKGIDPVRRWFDSHMGG